MKEPERSTLPAGQPPYLRLSIGGIFMGLANLVPGVSGGTMVLALGLYEEFIGAFSDLSRFKFSFRSIVVVAMLFGIAGMTFLLLAGAIQFLMETFLPGMLALFIGMTLGGAPTLWKEMRPLSKSGVAFAIGGIVVMALVAFVLRPDTTNPTWIMFFMGGVVGSATMILPGISGSYMLLVLGLYLPIIGSVSRFKDALTGGDLPTVMDIGTGVVLPVGLGVLAGLVVLSNLLRYLLHNHHRATLGFLMGLLLGSVFGLYPFQEPEFGKLPRYAVETEDGSRELRVVAAGWEPGTDNVIERNLREAVALYPDVEITNVATVRTADGFEQAVGFAREAGAVLIAYDTRVPDDARDAAAQEPGVELIIVPNTEFAVSKLLLVIVLIGVGFAITWRLGRAGGEPVHEI